VLHLGQIAEQDIAPDSYSEPDTLVEARHRGLADQPGLGVAAAHDGRYPDGGAVDIS